MGRGGGGCPRGRGAGTGGRSAAQGLAPTTGGRRDLLAAGAPGAPGPEAARRSQGMTSLREAALQLVREGETTPEELLKITFYEE